MANQSDPQEAAVRKRRHLPAAERERLIVESATKFFAEHGFEGQIRDLARAMGITHSAIFRYFPSKEALIERVYEHVFVRRWNPDWGPLISNRSLTLENRLVQFYQEYAERIFDYQWVRIFIFSGLKAYSITPRYMALVRDKLIRPACGELRAELGLPSPNVFPITEREEEAFWSLHGKVFYLAIRKFIYELPIPKDPSQTIEDDVRVFLGGVAEVVRQSCETRK